MEEVTYCPNQITFFSSELLYHIIKELFPLQYEHSQVLPEENTYLYKAVFLYID